jgi:hypothetical protein
MRGTRLYTALFAGVFPFLGIILLAISYFAYRSNERALETGVLTTGVVVGMEERYDSDGTMYAPIVRFTTTQGEVVEFTSSTWRHPAAYESGDTVEILYQPNDPRGAVIDSAFERYGTPAILGFVGLCIAIGGGLAGVLVHKVLAAGSSHETSWLSPEPTETDPVPRNRRGGRPGSRVARV